jgi:hypothetical protein
MGASPRLERPERLLFFMPKKGLERAASVRDSGEVHDAQDVLRGAESMVTYQNLYASEIT